MPLNANIKRYLANIRAARADKDAHSGFGQMVAKAWEWQSRKELIVESESGGVGRGYVCQGRGISAEKADQRTMKRIKGW